MRTDLTTGFSNAMAAAANAPVLLLRIEWPALGALAGLTLRFSDRALVIGGQTWEARVLDWQRDASGAVRSMTLWNGVSNPAAGFARFSDLLQAYPPELAEVVLYRWFDGAGLDETDFAALFSGMLADPIEFDETECRLGLAPYSETLGRKVVGAVLATSDYPNLPEENLGAVKPIVIGSVSDAPGLRVRRVNRTRLISVAAPGAETLDVGDTSGFPASGALVVNDDEVAYTGRTAQAFTGCTGVSEFHYADDEVLEKISDHRFLFSDADYPIQSIANVKVSGEPVDPAGYMVDLAKGEVVFTAQPREVRAADRVNRAHHLVEHDDALGNRHPHFIEGLDRFARVRQRPRVRRHRNNENRRRPGLAEIQPFPDAIRLRPLAEELDDVCAEIDDAVALAQDAGEHVEGNPVFRQVQLRFCDLDPRRYRQILDLLRTQQLREARGAFARRTIDAHSTPAGAHRSENGRQRRLADAAGTRGDDDRRSRRFSLLHHQAPLRTPPRPVTLNIPLDEKNLRVVTVTASLKEHENSVRQRQADDPSSMTHGFVPFKPKTTASRSAPSSSFGRNAPVFST